MLDLDSHLTLQDKVRLHLGEYGTNKVHLTTEELASELQVDSYTAYQTLARLQRKHEIEIEKDGNKVVGVTILKLEPSSRTYQRAADRAKDSIETTSENYAEQMVALKEYLNKKLAIADMQQRAKDAGLNPEDTVKFEQNPYAEEGLILLTLLSRAVKELDTVKEKLTMAEYDVLAEKRNVEYLQRLNREETNRGLIAIASN